MRSQRGFAVACLSTLLAFPFWSGFIVNFLIVYRIENCDIIVAAIISVVVSRLITSSVLVNPVSEEIESSISEIEAQGPPRRQRTIYTPDHLQEMEEVFRDNRYPDVGMCGELAVRLCLDESRIQVWCKTTEPRCETWKGIDKGGRAGDCHE
ncbi:Homeobox protein EgHBX4 [Taenia solium]|eukprot:TsM_000206300 transcript=TsM_000206300 gene=TsM_000206300